MNGARLNKNRVGMYPCPIIFSKRVFWMKYPLRGYRSEKPTMVIFCPLINSSRHEPQRSSADGRIPGRCPEPLFPLLYVRNYGTPIS